MLANLGPILHFSAVGSTFGPKRGPTILNFYPTGNLAIPQDVLEFLMMYGPAPSPHTVSIVCCVFLFVSLALSLATVSLSNSQRPPRNTTFFVGLVISVAMAMTVHTDCKLISCTNCTKQNSEIQKFKHCTSYIVQQTCPSS